MKIVIFAFFGVLILNGQSIQAKCTTYEIIVSKDSTTTTPKIDLDSKQIFLAAISSRTFGDTLCAGSVSIRNKKDRLRRVYYLTGYGDSLSCSYETTVQAAPDERKNNVIYTVYRVNCGAEAHSII